MTRALLRHLARETDSLQQAGLLKPEVAVEAGSGSDEAIVFTENDFLGLSRRPEIARAAIAAIETHRPGLSSPRPFGGTLAVHHELERRLADFLGCADALVYSNGYLANVGLFDSLFDARDYIIVDAAVHPSLAEGIRLCGARVAAYRSEDLENLEDRLKRSKTARFRVVVTDGIYPLTGRTAALDAIVKLARRFDALVVVHDSLGIGVLGARQRGTTEHCGVTHRVDLITGGFTDVLGGTPGGFVAGRSEVVSWLRQKSTPYLFSGALGPGDVAATDAALDLIDQGEAPAVVLDRAAGLKELLLAHDFKVSGEGHAILAIEVGTVVTLQRMINALSELHVYVQGMCYPVVPENAARIQLKLTPAHTESVLKAAVERIAQAAHTLHSP